jgi:hypothetical protein
MRLTSHARVPAGGAGREPSAVTAEASIAPERAHPQGGCVDDLQHHRGVRLSRRAAFAHAGSERALVRRPASHIQHVIEAGLIPALVPLARSASLDLKTEAAYAIYNATAMATREQMEYLVAQQVALRASRCCAPAYTGDGRRFCYRCVKCCGWASISPRLHRCSPWRSMPWTICSSRATCLSTTACVPPVTR